MYNPLFDTFEEPIRLQWQLVLEDLCKKVERAIIKKRLPDVWFNLNIIDIVCSETGMYYREYGFDVIGKGNEYESEIQGHSNSWGGLPDTLLG